MAEAPDVDLTLVLRRRRRRRRRLIILAVLLAGWTAAAVVLRRPWFEGNFGVVEAGRAFRSAQPGGDFPDLIARCKLSSVLNLRGGAASDPWYVAEVEAIERTGIDFYDFPMSATRRPTRRELLILIDVFARCRYPLLIHCKSGSDRTGLAAAVYRLMRGEPPQTARRAFSLAYGHMPLFGTRHLHEPLDEYQAWLDAERLAHEPRRFRHWVETAYPSDDPSIPSRPLPVGPRVPVRVARQRVAPAPR